MLMILLAYFAYLQPEDFTPYYGMDINIASFSRFWENAFETTASGFRTSQGCHDMQHWYQVYDAKAEVPFGKLFKLRYQYRMLRDFETSANQHRFEPTLLLPWNLNLHFMAVPSYYKSEDEAGLGISWRNGQEDWMAVYGIAESFDHNMSIKYVPAGPDNDSFMQIPYRIELDSRFETDWMRARLHARLGTLSRQRLHWPDSAQYEWEKERQRSSAWGRLELNTFGDFWVGSGFSWRGDYSETAWSTQEIVTYDNILDAWIQPFISWSPTPRLELFAEHQIWRFDRDMDSVSYRRDYQVFTSLISWNPIDILILQAGYQRSWRYIYNDGQLLPDSVTGRITQSRILANIELRFRSGFMVVIKEGIEMDTYPYKTFRYPHNHTYVSVYMPLDIFDSNEF
jgi:hypothetical protein